MDINTLRGIATILVMAAFLGICIWAYSSKRKDDFNEAANLPFADDDDDSGKGKDAESMRTDK